MALLKMDTKSKIEIAPGYPPPFEMVQKAIWFEGGRCGSASRRPRTGPRTDQAGSRAQGEAINLMKREGGYA